MAQKALSFEELPLDKSGPMGNAWGRWKDKDQLGMLNLLTAEKVQAASREIRTGTRVSLDWELDRPHFPFFGRQKFFHHIHHKAPRVVNDDMIVFNTQCSSQWDGFRHFGRTSGDLKHWFLGAELTTGIAYQDAKQFYGGFTQEDIMTSQALGINGKFVPTNWPTRILNSKDLANDILVWLENGGIVSRGVLLDFHSWAQKKNLNVDPFTRYPITAVQLQELMADEGITTEPGDVLFIRSGWMATHMAIPAAEEETHPSRKKESIIGVESSIETLRWIWEHQFGAVAGDMPGFEQAPIWEASVQLHQWLLAGWGCPIGEMFNLEDLAKECKRLGRHHFFLTSMPLRVSVPFACRVIRSC